VASGTYFTVTTILKLTPALLLHRHFSAAYLQAA
jgi:hypothetical protein